MKWTSTAAAAFSTTMRTSSSATAASSPSEMSQVTQRMLQVSQQETQKLMVYYAQEAQSPTSTSAKLPTVWTTAQEASEFVQNKIDALLFDCDGVIYRSPDPAPGARQCLQNLLDQGKHVYFVTNSAAVSRAQLRDKLTAILDMPEGVLQERMMVGSAFSTAQYLKQIILDKKKESRVFVIGSEGLCQELRQTGFEVMDENDCDQSSMSRAELANHDFSKYHDGIDAVVVGHDTDLNYRKLSIAYVLLQQNPHARLVATNLDSFDLVGADGRHIPGNGGAVKYLEHTSQRTAINCGKPSPLLAELLDSLYGLDPQRAMFVGDRLDTDIRFGIDTGMHAALVMTGVTTAQKMMDLKEGTNEEPLPNFILPHMGFLA